MTKFETWIFKRIFRKVGPTEVMELVWAETHRRFYEDNVGTRGEYLKDLIDGEVEFELHMLRERFG